MIPITSFTSSSSHNNQAKQYYLMPHVSCEYQTVKILIRCWIYFVYNRIFKTKNRPVPDVRCSAIQKIRIISKWMSKTFRFINWLSDSIHVNFILTEHPNTNLIIFRMKKEKRKTLKQSNRFWFPLQTINILASLFNQ